MSDVNSMPLLDDSMPQVASTPARKNGRDGNHADYQIVETPKRMKDELKVMEQKIQFFKAAYHLDEIEFDSTEEMLEAISIPRSSDTLKPTGWETRVYAIKHWETGDPNTVADPKKFRAQFRSSGYDWFKRFFVVTNELGEDQLFKRKKALEKGEKPPEDEEGKEVVHILRVFDIIRENHRKVACLKSTTTHKMVCEKYSNISERECAAFCATCPDCGTDVTRTEKHKGALKPIVSTSFRDRFQADLIDNRNDPQTDVYGRKMKWLLVLKDHFTRLKYMVPIPSKAPKYVAQELYHIFVCLVIRLFTIRTMVKKYQVVRFWIYLVRLILESFQ